MKGARVPVLIFVTLVCLIGSVASSTLVRDWCLGQDPNLFFYSNVSASCFTVHRTNLFRPAAVAHCQALAPTGMRGRLAVLPTMEVFTPVRMALG